MEVILDAAEGVPEGGVLSIKVGDMKRQAPVNKFGQPFRFTNSPAELTPLKVELLVPAVEPQLVYLQPGQERFQVNFGKGIKVSLTQRAAPQLQRSPVDIGEVAQKRGLPTDKMQMAQSAAQYLDEHDLVRTFQDLLHGLLMHRPEDPMAYVAKKLATQRRLTAESVKQASNQSSRRPSNASVGQGSAVVARRKGKSQFSRSTVASARKVDALLITLQATRDNLDVVLPFLPIELRETLVSEELAQECRQQFEMLDSRRAGKLTPQDLIPLIVQLTTARSSSIPQEQCKKFVNIFDSDEDGLISVDEFTTLLQFVVIAAYLESDEGRSTLQTAKLEEQHYSDFLMMIETDMEKLWSIIPFLPAWLEEHLTSRDFMTQCDEKFIELDKDESGALEPMELLPVIEELCQAHPLAIDYEKCKKFVKLFDQHQNGVILQDEFVEFAQYVAVMNFLSSPLGQKVNEQAALLSRGRKIQEQVKLLEEAPRKLIDIFPELPRMLHDLLLCSSFEKTCTEGFEILDRSKSGIVQDELLLPIVVKLSEGHPFSFDLQTCRKYFDLFDQENKARKLDKIRFLSFARYAMCLAFLTFSRDNQDMLVSDVLMGKDKIKNMLAALRENVAQIGEIVPFLPESLKTKLLGAEFQAQCMSDFSKLDKDRSGVLEPRECLPVVIQLTEAHSVSMTEEDAIQFVDIFDSERNGVITKQEYVNFVRFMIIMAYLASAEGASVMQDVTKQGQEQIEDWLKTMENDRYAVQKVVSLLPKHVFDHLTSDVFVQKCNERFQELDKDRAGVLRPQQLVPLVADLTGAYAGAVTDEHGQRFTKIFDVYGDGVLRPDEFLDFLRFLFIMGYLQSEEGKELSKDCLTIMNDSKRIEDLLTTLEQDRRQIQSVLPFLPCWLHDEVISSHFTQKCMLTFQELDKNGSGTLEPEELYPLVLTMADTHNLALDIDQCKRFTAIFDDAGDGVIRKDEFVNFCRFQMVMSYLQGQEGQKVLCVIKEKEEGQGQASSSTELAVSSSQLQTQDFATLSPRSGMDLPPETGHLVVDKEFYQKKSEKLKAENETLRGRMQSLEELVRMMEQKLEDQEMRLRHAEVDLQARGR